MVHRRFCDVCNSQMPDPDFEPHPKAVKMDSGLFILNSENLMKEHVELCMKCANKVSGHIQLLKNKREQLKDECE